MQEHIETTIDKFIFRIAADRLYTPEGIWLLRDASTADGHIRIGVTDYVQQLNGDVAFAHVKPVGTPLAAGDEFAEIETIKANISALMPIAGVVAEINPDLERYPERINQEPYDRGWLAVIATTDWDAAQRNLLDPQAYLATMKAQAEKELNG